MSQLAVGSVVVSANPAYPIFGEVTEIFPFYRTGHMANQLLHHVHAIDAKTGRKVACPDKRCKGEHTCPVHGWNRWADEIRVLNKKDLKQHIQFGLLDKSYTPKEAICPNESK